MRTATILMLIAATGLLATAVMACASKPPAREEPPPRAETMETLLKRLRELEATSTCQSTAECHTLAIGERLCGGPSAWLAMSSANLPEARSVGERYTALHKAANVKAAASGMASTCEILPEPGVACVAGYCRLQPRGPGGPGGRAD